MRIIPGYLRRVVIAAIVLVSLTLLGVESFMEFINELPDIGKKDYGILQAMAYVSMQLPSDVYQLFPIAGFLGSLLGMGRLANNSELIVMRASGISVAGITWMVVKTTLMLLIVISVVGEWWAPRLQHQANLLKLSALHQQPEAEQRELWFRHGNTFVHLDHLSDATHLNGIMSYQFNSFNQLVSITSAPLAVYQQGYWHLLHATVNYFKQQAVMVKHFPEQILPFSFQPVLLQQLDRDTDEENLIELQRNIQARHQAGLIATRYELNFWQRILQPATILVMVCLGIPFIFGSLRQASTGARLLIGVTIGFGFYMINRFIGPMTLVYQWPSWMVAALPTLLFMSLCVFLIYRVK